MKKKIEKLKKLLNKHNKISIIVHKAPDGDALGSSLALMIYLKKKGKDVTVISPDNFPDFLKYLPYSNDILIYNNNKEKTIEKLKESELLFCIDFNSLNRINNIAKFISKLEAEKILIDHHQPSNDISDFSISFDFVNSCATAEIVYNIIVSLGDKNLIDTEIGECLYTAIMTDSGSFKYSCTTAQTHYITAHLLNIGVKHFLIHENIFGNFSLNRMKLLGYALLEKLKIIEGYNVAYISLSKQELEKYEYKIGDTEGFVNFCLSIKNIMLAVLMIEKKDRIKLSLRSKGNFSVDELAKKYFNGGGHTNAAGGYIFTKNINEAEKIFINIVKSINNLKSEF